MANLLVERSQNTNWVVVYKALLTVHHLLCYGNERFTQYLASSNSTFQLSNFLDKSGVQGESVSCMTEGGLIMMLVLSFAAAADLMCLFLFVSPAGSVSLMLTTNSRGSRWILIVCCTGYDMSPFIRRYAKYLNEKALSYRTVAFDFCKVKRGKGDGTLRTMNADKLLKTLPVLQAQLDALLEFDCSSNDLTNGVINMCFMLLFRDLIRLFACYNDGIINLLEKYFDMNKKQCREALDLYKKFLIRMDRVAEFLKVAENVGIDKGDIPDLTKAPSSLLDALEQHLAALEGKKGSAANTPTQTASSRTNLSRAVTALSSTSSAFGSAAAHNSARLEAAAALQQQANGALAASIDECLKRQALAEEEAAMNQYKEKHKQSPTQGSSTNPFLSSPTNSGGGAPIGSKASDDLLQLSGNPFADMFGGAPTVPPQPAAAAAPASNMWATNGFAGASPMPAAGATGTAPFVSDKAFSSVFGESENSDPNPFMSDFGGGGGGPTKLPSGPSLEGEAAIFGESSVFSNSPARPPPPTAAKSAFDDLNDSIRAALGGSPARSAPSPTPAQAAQSPPMAFNTATPPVGFGSPARQNSVVGAAPQPGAAQQGKVLTGDLDSSLASLAENLSINKAGQPSNKGMQWSSPKNAAKPGANWTPQPMAATTGANYRPMGPGMHGLPVVAAAAVPIVPYTAMYPTQPFPPMGMWPAGQQPMMGAPQGAGMMAGAPMQPQQQQPPLDPFGALYCYAILSPC
ncbi:hypothetical protein B566_EDAN013079 [Ephemera danica]|nr:hypothetical protein B566_EDAN013079 [Ephemera danica]